MGRLLSNYLTNDSSRSKMLNPGEQPYETDQNVHPLNKHPSDYLECVGESYWVLK